MHVSPRKHAKPAFDYYRSESIRPSDASLPWGTLNVPLDVRLQADDAERLFRGCHPRTGLSLFKNPSIKRRSGWDLTFVAPKSVSIAWGLAPDDTSMLLVENAHVAAVLAAISLFANKGLYISGHPTETPGAGGFLFNHGLSRWDDPHLHTHGYLLNAGFLPATGWRALTLDQRWTDVVRRAYRAELAWRLRSYGLTLFVSGGRFDIERTKHLVTLFSKAGEEYGRTGTMTALLWKSVRRPKDENRSVAKLRKAWTTTAIIHGFDPGQLTLTGVPADILTDKAAPLRKNPVTSDDDDTGGRFPLALFDRLLADKLAKASLTDIVAEAERVGSEGPLPGPEKRARV